MDKLFLNNLLKNPKYIDDRIATIKQIADKYNRELLKFILNLSICYAFDLTNSILRIGFIFRKIITEVILVFTQFRIDRFG